MKEGIILVICMVLALLLAVGMIVTIGYLLRSTTDTTPSSIGGETNILSVGQSQTLVIGTYFYKDQDSLTSLMFSGISLSNTAPTLEVTKLTASVGYGAGNYNTFAFHIPLQNSTTSFSLEGHTWEVTHYDISVNTITLERLT